MSKMETPNIAAKVAAVQERIAAAAGRVGRRPEDITLVAVTKTVETARIRQGIAAGLTVFGENYVQEARAKIPAVASPHVVARLERRRAGLPENPAEVADKISWHLIGHLQSNKAKYSVELFSLIHSVDNYQLAQEIGKQASKRGKTQAILLEVNLSGNPDRAGVAPEQALTLAEQMANIPGVQLQGLMGIPPLTDEAEGARPYFAQLRHLWKELPEENRQILSMGMSGDFEIAIEEGTTHVRIGTALFGRRQQT
jgi:PLP dependent protein